MALCLKEVVRDESLERAVLIIRKVAQGQEVVLHKSNSQQPSASRT